MTEQQHDLPTDGGPWYRAEGNWRGFMDGSIFYGYCGKTGASVAGCHLPRGGWTKGEPAVIEKCVKLDDVIDAVQGNLCELGITDKLKDGKPVRVFCNELSALIINEVESKATKGEAGE